MSGEYDYPSDPHFACFNYFYILLQKFNIHFKVRKLVVRF